MHFSAFTVHNIAFFVVWKHKKEVISEETTSFVRRMRLELTRSCDHYPLKVACIPISPPARSCSITAATRSKNACAQNRTRTCTPRGMRTWNARVYQFRHLGKKKERKTRLELATPTLARSCSTNWAISAFFLTVKVRSFVLHFESGCKGTAFFWHTQIFLHFFCIFLHFLLRARAPVPYYYNIRVCVYTCENCFITYKWPFPSKTPKNAKILYRWFSMSYEKSAFFLYFFCKNIWSIQKFVVPLHPLLRNKWVSIFYRRPGH